MSFRLSSRPLSVNYAPLPEKIVGVTQARSEFSTLVEQDQNQSDTYIISRHGKAAAVVVDFQIYET
jgi:PHD/YefM family antitoxin component YafN of YafNO toxin-antitoxin module